MSAAVVTVTLNPAIDLTVTLDRLVDGAVHRSSESNKQCGGKGVNVAACLSDWGTSCLAAGVLGADNAALFARFLGERAIEDGFVRVPGETRTNIKLVDRATGHTTSVNLDDPAPDEVALDALLRWTEAALSPAAGEPPRILVLGGSLPDSLPAETYRTLIARLARPGLSIVLVSAGPAMDAALAPGGTLPACIKLNRAELEAHVGRSLPELAAVAEAAAGLVRSGIGLVAVSLGADGALLVDPAGALHARAPDVPVRNSIGAGDALVAGLVAGMLDRLSDRALLARGMAFAVAKLGLDGAGLPEREVVQAIERTIQVEPVAESLPGAA